MEKLEKKQLIRPLLFVVVVFVAAAILEVACMLVASRFNSLYHGFNFAWYFFFCGVGLTILLVYYIFKEKIKNVETIFLVISLIVGSVMILSSPFGHTCWDLESHFNSVLSYASFDGQVSDAEELFAEDGGATIFKHGYQNNQDFISEVNAMDQSFVNKSYSKYLITHIPGAVAYDLAKLLGLPFNVRLDFIRFLYLFLYSIICYFAIKKLRTSKLIFATIGLFPTCLFLASNITYDWWVISFCMLGIAYFFSEYQQPEKEMKIYEIILMSGSIFIGCYVKAVYFLLLFVPLFMKKSYFKTNKKAKFTYFAIVVFFEILLLTVFLSSFLSISSSGDNRGGGNVNPSEQLNFILTNPIKYTFILVNFFTNYMSVANIVNLTSSFAHLTSGEHLTIARDFGVFLIVLIVVTVIDRNSFDKLSTTWKFKILSFIAFFISAILIITALYIDFNNVGVTKIQGVQARYLIPLLPMLLPTLGFVNKSHSLKWPEKNVKTGYVIIVSLFLFWDIAHTMLLQLI